MFVNGAIVSLKERKTHGEGEDEMSLAAGVCGMVVQIKKKAVDSNHEYVVDFGPYGQWYCYHGELNGQEPVREEGYDNDDELPNNNQRVTFGDLNSVEPILSYEEPLFSIDFEADLKRRMKEIENGNIY